MSELHSALSNDIDDIIDILQRAKDAVNEADIDALVRAAVLVADARRDSEILWNRMYEAIYPTK